jgi:hypothetical protein
LRAICGICLSTQTEKLLPIISTLSGFFDAVAILSAVFGAEAALTETPAMNDNRNTAAFFISFYS